MSARRPFHFPVAKTVATVALAFALTPTLLVVLASFSGGDHIAFPPASFSFDAYISLLSEQQAVNAILHSLAAGGISVLIAVPIGTLAAFALHGLRGGGRTALAAYLQLGIVTPLVVSGIAFLVLFSMSGLVGTVHGLAIALAIVNLPFVVMIVGIGVEKMDPALGEAARTLGAEKVQTFLFVSLPQIAPSILTSCLLLFVFGINEFLVSLILVDADSVTLPVYAFGSLRSGLSPRLAAAGGLYVAITAVVVLLLGRSRALSRFFSRRNEP